MYNIWNYLENLFDVSGIMNEIVKGVGCIALSSVIALIYILYNNRSLSFYKALYKAIFSKNTNDNKTEFRENYKKFRGYIPHNVTNLKDNSVLSFKEFLKTVKDSNIKCAFVFGPSGIGKSTLVQQLAFKMKSTNQKGKVHGLLDYGIIYRQFNSQMLSQEENGCDALLNIFKHINNDLVNSDISNATILLDGFDEIADLLVEDSKKVFLELVNQLSNLIDQHSQTNKINKIVISLRPEIFSNGIVELSDFNISSLVFEVNKLNKQQALRMYKNVSVQNGEKHSTQKNNLARLERIMENCNDGDSVFSYPFIMEWAPELFSEFPDDDKLNEQNLYLILDTIINKALEREEKTLKKVYTKKSHAESNELYTVTKGREFIRFVATSMLKQSPSEYKMTYDELTKDTEKANEKLVNTTRRLLRISNTATLAGTQSRYTFLHNMFYWFEVADVLSDIKTDITKRERVDILNSLKYSLVPMLYVQALKEKYGRNIKLPEILPNSPVDLTHIDFTRQGYHSAFINELFPLLPYLQTLTVNDVILNKEATQILINKGELDLSERNADALKCLDCFSSEYIKNLDISSCEISSFDFLSEYICNFINLQELCVFNNTVKLDEICEKAKEYKSNPILLCSLHSTQDLDFLCCGYNLPFKEIQISFSDNNPFNQLYKNVYDKRKEGFEISVWNPSVFEEQDNCCDLDLLEAIYELNKLIMIRLINNQLVEFLPVAKRYISFLTDSNDDIQIKIENSFIKDIIDHNGLTERITWFDSVSIADIKEADIETEYKNRKAQLNLALELYIYNFIHVAYLYAFALEKAGSEEKIKTVFDYIAGIIVDKCKCYTWCIKYESLHKTDIKAAEFFNFLNVAANCKNPKNGYAQWLVGECYFYGKCVETNYSLAFEWYKKSAENDCAEGMVNLGWCYHKGYGTVENPDLAFEWYKKSAENGSATGMYQLGWCYHKGYGTDENPVLAFEWYKKSAENGLPPGISFLGECYETGIGCDENKEKAYNLYVKASKKGSSSGMCNLGRCYIKGIGVEQDLKQGFFWSEKSAKKGNLFGMTNLGLCYHKGYGTDENPALAFEWYKKSAEKGCAEAMNRLGWCYRNGYGTDENLDLAFEWYKKSAEKGCATGMNNLGLCYHKGYGTDENPALAFEWYKKSAENGCKEAVLKLVWCFEVGYGTEPSAEEATRWSEKLKKKS